MPVKVVLLGREDCCLCAEAKEVIERVRGELQFELEELDLDAHPHLKESYGEQIPVVFINGRKAFKYHVNEEEFRKKLRKYSATRPSGTL